ncbi:hypothetical protein [Chryseobacterium profundimaris]|uniref:Integrase catalytic domain-containing protein n=1 Tax=Chryseobacterium profundimaris TaxID=1387275 RepID=A0ABY1NG44_9FLAO|nr:hypothetical protein [Chryseobacterium profundimaris]SMP08884.1 hypothetical protein SAMN06264346_1027 [Chryseobacterium profundimaris]
MPEIWDNTNAVAVTVAELVPEFWSSQNVLSMEISRNRKSRYGVKALQRGCRNRKLLINFDTLPLHIQEALGDPRKKEHNLQKWYRTEAQAVDFYSMFRRPDGSSLIPDEQSRYITNASVLRAVLHLRDAHLTERTKHGMSLKGLYAFLCDESNSFNSYLERKKMPLHNLPSHPTRFKETLKAFETDFKYNGKLYDYNYLSIVKDVEGKRKLNPVLVDERLLMVLNGLFANQKHKPTATEIYRNYDAFLSGYCEIYNEETGEIFQPKEFPKISESTVKRYLAKWENRAATYKMRSGDRQKYMALYKPHHQLERPTFAGSLISIDDRQPPFKDLSGKRVWFYNGLDVASGCITVFVYGKSKEGIIIEFYRQMIRNYTEWGFNLPHELEAESSLNSPFTKTFLQEGYLFDAVRIEANNARGKRIERDNGILRYGIEKKRAGWIARPTAKAESNQAGADNVPLIPYDEIVENAITDIFELNNSPYAEGSDLTRWEYFIQNQHPELKPIRWNAILPLLGYPTETSCNAGYIALQGKKRALAENGEIVLGSKLIEFLKQIEGKSIDVYWLDDNAGNVLKAVAFYKGRYICEVQEMPKYNRATIERTQECEKAREIQSSYVTSVEGFIRSQEKGLHKINIIHKPKTAPKNGFFIPGMHRSKSFIPDDPETLKTVTVPAEPETFTIPEAVTSWKNSFFR